MEPYWLQLARAELRHGVYEIPGPGSESRIEEYQTHSSAGWPHSDDAIAWCSDFVGWCIEGGDRKAIYVPQPILIGTKSAAARSWLKWGVSVFGSMHWPVGAIVVSSRGRDPQPGREVVAAPGHVNFFAGYATPHHYIGVGGNQSNMVRASIYPLSKVLDARWPA